MTLSDGKKQPDDGAGRSTDAHTDAEAQPLLEADPVLPPYEGPAPVGSNDAGSGAGTGTGTGTAAHNGGEEAHPHSHPHLSLAISPPSPGLQQQQQQHQPGAAAATPKGPERAQAHEQLYLEEAAHAHAQRQAHAREQAKKAHRRRHLFAAVAVLLLLGVYVLGLALGGGWAWGVPGPAHGGRPDWDGELPHLVSFSSLSRSPALPLCTSAQPRPPVLTLPLPLPASRQPAPAHPPPSEGHPAGPRPTWSATLPKPDYPPGRHSALPWFSSVVNFSVALPAVGGFVYQGHEHAGQQEREREREKGGSFFLHALGEGYTSHVYVLPSSDADANAEGPDAVSASATIGIEAIFHDVRVRDVLWVGPMVRGEDRGVGIYVSVARLRLASLSFEVPRC